MLANGSGSTLATCEGGVVGKQTGLRVRGADISKALLTKLNHTYSVASIVLQISLLHFLLSLAPPSPPPPPPPPREFQSNRSSLLLPPLMEFAAVLRPFHYSTGTLSHMRFLLEKPGLVPMYNAAPQTLRQSCVQRLTIGGKLVSSPIARKETLISCVKTSETAVTAKSNDSSLKGSLQKNSVRTATFPNGFEALILEVCDETEVAELKLKVGDFEMHLKRNIGATKFPMSNISPTTPPPIPTEPMDESAPVAAPSSPSPSSLPPKSTSEKTNPFTNVSSLKSSKLAALEASGTNAYVIVSSPTVGSFRRGRTVKGKKQPPICKEGDVIKEGQVIGFLDQFGTQLPVRSDVAGEVLKFLFDDGEAIGYGEPLIAVLPSFHGIK
ncbi:uncharacterized protein LOC131166978 [Malania oleifera]|uniref:uncharacterized protein LOC131166978 n=1 Tax=Malania oleifera TaxID=397392 RepID=UPI0025AE05D4|nr:uncharacterized protein LOC131166978 [Malania oleifera]